MVNETRVNLKHLLEDIRDAYTSPLEEVILTELVANALDGKALNISFNIDANNRVISCCDDGMGMKRAQLKEYHNIASSSKQRGMGIGFAGVGAKLSLLITEKVVTESKGGYGSQCATEWSMTGPYRAPWKFVPFAGSVKTSRGTAISLYFTDTQAHLLKAEFVEAAIVKHFYPLLSQKFYERFLKYFYKKPVSFFINGKKLALPEEGQEELQHWFNVTMGKSRHPAGVGFLVKTGIEPTWLKKMLGQSASATSLPSGLWISTFGKVIKGGWEWVGILPKNSEQLTGLVEIPALSEILTTNKNDFLSDQNSLKKYYKFRKAIQEAVLPILKELGEDREAAPAAPEKLLKPLNQTITGALNQLVDDFPELESLIGSKHSQMPGKARKEKANEQTVLPDSSELENADKQPGLVAEQNQNEFKAKRDLPPTGVFDESKIKTVRAKTSGLKLVLAEITDTSEMPLGRVTEDVLTINTGHPAWQKAKQRGLEEYHIIISVATVLAQFLESEKNPQDFLNRLLLAWAKETGQDKNGKLF